MDMVQVPSSTSTKVRPDVLIRSVLHPSMIPVLGIPDSIGGSGIHSRGAISVYSKCDEEFDGYLPQYLFPFFNRDHLNKKTKVGHYTAEIVVEILDKNNKLVPIRALLDTGTTSTILLRDYVKKGRAGGYKGKSTLWKTMGGNFTTKKKALVDFKFPELNTDKKVTWVCHVDETTKPEHALYDMIIGMDLMTAIGIYVDTDEKLIKWQGNITPLGRRSLDQDTVQAIYAQTQEAPIIQQAEQRQQKILDAERLQCSRH